jgi:hypothetical protein
VQAANYAVANILRRAWKTHLGLFKMIFSGDPRKGHPRSDLGLQIRYRLTCSDLAEELRTRGGSFPPTLPPNQQDLTVQRIIDASRAEHRHGRSPPDDFRSRH